MAQRTSTTALPFIEYQVATGNYDTTRSLIDRIVLHTEVGFKAGTEIQFDNPQTHVSAHYGVNYDGSLDHYLEEYYTAFHAGDYPMNQRSIGIEHEDLAKPNDPRPDILYATSAKLVADICRFYVIPCDRQHILKHTEVSDLGTSCPDALDVDRIVNLAQAILNPTPQPTPTPDDLTICRTDRDENWNCFTALCAKLGVVTDPDNKEQMKQNGLNAIANLTGTIATQDLNMTNLNKQIPALELEVETEKNVVTSIQQKLDIALKANMEPTSGLSYQSLYLQAESKLAKAQSDLTIAVNTISQLNKQLLAAKPKTFAAKLKFLLS